MTRASLSLQGSGDARRARTGLRPGAPAVRLRGLVLCLLALAAAILPAPAQAVEPVSGRYLASYGKIIRLEFRVLYPPPVSLIIEQYFPSGLEIISAAPMPQVYSRSEGKMKWIFKDLQPGAYTIAVEFDQPILSAEIQATLRYLYPGSGLFTESTVLP